MIYIEDELIKLNGVVLPGLVKSIEVTETAKVDEQEVEGSATKPCLPMLPMVCRRLHGRLAQHICALAPWLCVLSFPAVC